MFKADDVAVGTTAVELTASIDTDQEYVLHVYTGEPGFTIGDSALTSGNGIPVPSQPLRLPPGAKVYGVFTSGVHAVHVLAYSA